MKVTELNKEPQNITVGNVLKVTSVVAGENPPTDYYLVTREYTQEDITGYALINLDYNDTILIDDLEVKTILMTIAEYSNRNIGRLDVAKEAELKVKF